VSILGPSIWAWADIRRRTWSLLGLAVLIALPIGFSLALVAGAQRAGSSVDRYAESTLLADVVAFVDGEPDEATLERLSSDPRIARVDRSNPVVIVAEPIQAGESAFAVVGTADNPAGGLAAPMLLAGRYPRADAVAEIVVNERAADTYGLEVGMRAPLSGLVSFESWEARQLGEATIVGIVRTPFDLVHDPSTESLVMAGPALLDGGWTDLARPGTILWLHVGDRDDVAAVVSDLSTIVDGDVRAVADMLSTAERAADLQRRGLLVAGGVVAAVGLLVISQGIARHLAGRSADKEVLAAIGLTRGERGAAAWACLAPGLLVGIVGGLILAVGLSPLLPLGMPRRADPAVGVHADLLVLVIGLGAALLMTGTATATAIWRWLRSAPSRVGDRPALAARLASALRLRPVPLTGSRLALEDGHGRQRLPAVATLVALVATTSAAVGALVVGTSLDGLVNGPERYGQPWDTFVTSIHADELADVGARLAGDPRIVDVNLADQGELNVTGGDGTPTQIASTGLDGARGPMWLAALDGRAPAGPAEIAIASRTMTQLGLHVGDTTTVGGACGEREMTVVGRVIVPVMFGGDPDHGSIVIRETFDELCAAELIAEVDRSYGALLRFADPTTADAVLDDLFPEGYFTEPGSVPSTVTALEEIGQVPGLIAALVAVLGIAAAGNAVLLAVRRRGGEIAVLRALGLRPSDARRIFGWQAATMATVAAIAGIPLGILLGRIVWTGIARPANVVIRVDVAPIQLVATPILVVGVLLAVSIWPGRRAARLRPADLLRSE
jgi:ABC-type lipoprotein release transport system permease subunit